MRDETNRAFLKVIKQIKDLHSAKGFSFTNLRVVVRIYEDDKFEVVYICPPENDPVIYSWPNDFKPSLERDKPQKIVLFRFTKQGFYAPVIEFRKALFLVLNKYLARNGIASKFVARVVICDGVFSLSVISRDEILNQIFIYGTRSKEEKLLPAGNGDYLSRFKNGQVEFSAFSPEKTEKEGGVDEHA